MKRLVGNNNLMKINVLSMHHPFMWCVYECWFTLINHFNSNDDDSLELVYNFKFHKLFFLKSSFEQFQIGIF